jgi:hypothetical protein
MHAQGSGIHMFIREGNTWKIKPVNKFEAMLRDWRQWRKKKGGGGEWNLVGYRLLISRIRGRGYSLWFSTGLNPTDQGTIIVVLLLPINELQKRRKEKLEKNPVSFFFSLSFFFFLYITISVWVSLYIPQLISRDLEVNDQWDLWHSNWWSLKNKSKIWSVKL